MTTTYASWECDCRKPTRHVMRPPASTDTPATLTGVIIAGQSFIPNVRCATARPDPTPRGWRCDCKPGTGRDRTPPRHYLVGREVWIHGQPFVPDRPCPSWRAVTREWVPPIRVWAHELERERAVHREPEPIPVTRLAGPIGEPERFTHGDPAVPPRWSGTALLPFARGWKVTGRMVNDGPIVSRLLLVGRLADWRAYWTGTEDYSATSFDRAVYERIPCTLTGLRRIVVHGEDPGDLLL